MKLSLIVVFTLFVYVLGFSESDYTIQYSRLPPTNLGSLEGFYTSNSHYGKGLYICEDEDVIYGSFDEVGILQGNYNSTEGKASGNFYIAGTGGCQSGTFEITYHDDGFEGTMRCQGSGEIPFSEFKISPFRPTDVQCAVMDLSSVATINGRYQDQNGLYFDFCLNNNKVIASFLALENGVTTKTYFEGQSFEKGKIYVGTWYSETPNAGADLYYLGADGVVQNYFWTGLNGIQGDTVINPSEFRNPELHGTEAYYGPISQTGQADCSDYAKIKEVVLNGLEPNADDDDYYYFVTSNFNYRLDDDGGDDDGAIDDETYVSSAGRIEWVVIPLLLALFL